MLHSLLVWSFALGPAIQLSLIAVVAGISPVGSRLRGGKLLLFSWMMNAVEVAFYIGAMYVAFTSDSILDCTLAITYMFAMARTTPTEVRAIAIVLLVVTLFLSTGS